jgi:hypothetical protein
MLSSGVNRKTSKDLRVYFTPYGSAAATTVVELYLDPLVTTGNVYLRINGALTSAISMSAVDGAADDDAIATIIQTAIAGTKVPVIGDSGLHTIVATTDVTVADSDVDGYMTITFSGSLAEKLVRVSVAPTSAEYQTADYRVEYTTEGTQRIRLDGEAMKLDFQQTTETTDATPISDFHDMTLAIRQNMTGSLGIYHAAQSYRFMFGEDNLEGRMEIFPYGEGSGKEEIIIDARLSDYSESYPDHDKIECELSYERLGEPISPVGSVQA